MQTKINKLAIISGNGLMPIAIADECIKKKISYLLLPILGQTNLELYQSYNYETFGIGEIGKLFDILKKHHISHIILAGGVLKPNLLELQVDSKGAILLAKIFKAKFFGDDNLLTMIIDFIEKSGFNVIGAKDIIHDLISTKGNITKISPTKSDLEDIEIAKTACIKLGELDIGQGVIAEQKNILALEAAEGTDNLIKRSKILKKTQKGGVLVKMAKPQQDLRADLPSIGPDTIKLLHENNFNGIAISSGTAIIINKDKTIELADQLGIFIYGI